MTRYIGERDLGEYLAEKMKAPLVLIELPTDDRGVVLFRITGTEGEIIFGKTDDNLLVTIDLDHPDHITFT